VPTAADPGDILIGLLIKGLPPANMLLLLASEVDKRKKLFKYLKEHEVIIDCSVATGSGAKARGEQEAVLRSLAAATLKEQGKTLAPELMPILLDRVGFHPVALVNELRKLMLAAGKNTAISRDDLDELLGRTRQDALYELNGSIAEGNLAEALVQLQRLLDNGIHPLAIMASLRNFVRTALLFRALMDGCSTPFHPTMSFNSFQQQYLPQLQAGETWKKEFSAHPYALYNQFKDAAQGSLAQYSTWMELLLAAEFRLKGSPAHAELVLHRLLCSMLAPVPYRSAIPLAPLAKSPARITIIP
jgi:DNA polymerase-3 subunit delta